MEIMSTVTASAVLFITLVAQAFTKIMLMLLGVIIAFLAIPQSRVAAMLGIAVISAFAGGILIQVHSVQENWTIPFAMSISFGCGFIVFPFLTFFRKFNELVNQDKEVVELLFGVFKKTLKKFLKN